MKSRITTAILTALFLGAMFGGLFHMSMGMDMAGDTSDCPFMSHGEVLCSMSVFDHFGAWKDAFTAIAPTFLTLLATLAAVAVAISIAPNLALPQKLLYTRLQVSNITDRIFKHSVRPLQELFSNGILHPKLF
jgi:hypothetical protein